MSASGKTMNCEQFKEATAADPSATFEGADHALSCESCAAYQAEMQAFDARIATALAIDAPALTMPACNSADTGVGASMTWISQPWKGNCADLSAAAITISTAAHCSARGNGPAKLAMV